MTDLFLSILTIIIILGLVWIIPCVCICIIVTIKYLINNHKPIYIKDIKKELNNIDTENIRWAPFLNIIMLLIFVLCDFIDLLKKIFNIKPINKLTNKIKKYMNMLNNFFNNIRLK